MRIVSLLPSATEIVCALGLNDELVAVTHECDYPSVAAQKPVITSSVLQGIPDSLGIHRGITGLVHEGKSIYHLNESLLQELQPDLILTQELCEVCAVSYSIVEKAARVMPGETEVISLEPNSIWDILDNILLVGSKTGRQEEAEELVEGLRERVLAVKRRCNQVGRPRVYCMEWLSPPFAAGHWIAEMVDTAGGYDALARPGLPSEQIAWDDVVQFAPQILILMPCGFDHAKTVESVAEVTGLPGWGKLPAVTSNQVYAVDGSGYFNRPGPRIVDGQEILAQIIHPERFDFTFPARMFSRISV